jgi:hypothetical protein
MTMLILEGVHQDRDKTVLCNNCFKRQTSNFHGVCQSCDAKTHLARCQRCKDEPDNITWPESIL